MKLTVQVKLRPTPAQAAALEATLRACNEAASEVASLAWSAGSYRVPDLRRRSYYAIKARHGLGAQAAQHVIKKVADAYATRKANLRAGNYGRPGSKRRRRIEGKPIGFRRDAAQPFDARMLSWRTTAQTVSIWTVIGRLKPVAYTGSPGQLAMVADSPIGESDLVHQDGMWFLNATVEISEPELVAPRGFLGVDLGIVNIATDSDGRVHAGAELNRYRRRQIRLRQRLQAKGTKSAKRLLRLRRRKEARHAAHTNHVISKRIVAEAARTSRGIAVEELTGIRGGHLQLPVVRGRCPRRPERGPQHRSARC